MMTKLLGYGVNDTCLNLKCSFLWYIKNRVMLFSVFELKEFSGLFSDYLSQRSKGRFWGKKMGDPFDDPFFTKPFEDLLEPKKFSSNASSISSGRGLTIEELPSDEEEDEEQNDKSENQPSIEHPGDDSDAERKIRNVNHQRIDLNQTTLSRANTFTHPEDDSDAEKRIRNVNQRTDLNRREGNTQSFRHYTSKVTYGGIDGAYYTSRRTRRAGSDGVVVEESREADKTTGEATHRISRGINDKGHSVTRKLNSSGGIESTQTLHNLEEDELSGFEEAWKGNSSLAKHESTASDHSFGGWLHPSLDQTRRRDQGGSSRSGAPGAKKVVRINIE